VHQQIRVVSQFSVQCIDKREEMVDAVSEQWHFGEVMGGQRTDIKSISGYGWWDNCQKYYSIHFLEFALSLLCKGPCFSIKYQNKFIIYFMDELWGMQ
jgi:hypothetical protein